VDKIFIDSALSVGSIHEIKGYNQHHLSVAGISTGDPLIIGDKHFREYKAEIIEVTKDSFVADVKSKIEICRVPPRDITLFVALPKRRKIESIIFKCTQLGVNKFVPFISSRTIKKINSRQKDKNYSRWLKKARNGAEISKRRQIPKIRDAVSFKEALHLYEKEEFKSGIIFWEQNDGQKYISEDDLVFKMAVFIGPEGGFSSPEIGSAKESGLKVRTLGNLILDVETASVAVASNLLCRED
jgi:16S rRNA (uracil1498-N3)-methyltransferase